MAISRTAQQVAFFRALESAGRPDARLFDDPYAIDFLDRSLAAAARAARLPLAKAAIERFVDRRHPDARAPVVVRTKLIDDAVEEAAQAGAESFVALGAGFDARALRLPAVAALPAYELDMPATQEVKKERLRRRLGRLPENVTYVPLDLEAGSVGEPLERAGLEPGERSVFVWEGVVSYLSQGAVDATLRWIAGTAAPGSRLATTYVDPTGLPEGRPPWAEAVERAGEPFRFGLPAAGFADFLAERGLRVLWDFSIAEALRSTAAAGALGSGPAFYRVALAEVGPVG